MKYKSFLITQFKYDVGGVSVFIRETESEKDEYSMRKLGKEVLHDAKFIKGHQLQPKWYKFAKILIVLTVLTGYELAFGWKKTAVFFVTFLLLMLIVHLLYRSKTKKYTQSWLDFIVVEENGVRTPRRIGGYYYASILVNALLAFTVSQLLG